MTGTDGMKYPKLEDFDDFFKTPKTGIRELENINHAKYVKEK
jgi:hypothetical protein